MDVLIRVGWIAILLNTIVGCERAPTDLQMEHQVFAVHLVLEAGSSTAFAIVSQTDLRGLAQPAFVESLVLHRGSTQHELAIFGGSGCPSDVSCYAATLEAPLQNGEHVSLAGAGPSGQISGQAAIPSEPAILSPLSGTTVDVSCTSPQDCEGGPFQPEIGRFSLKLDSDSTVGLVQITLRSDSILFNGEWKDGECSFSFTEPPSPFPGRVADVLIRISGVRCEGPSVPIEWDTIAAVVHVLALDTAYARYHDEMSNERTRRPAAGIIGAAGVFAGVSRATRELLLVRNE